MTSRKDIFSKYYASDIFNLNPEFGIEKVKPKLRLNRSTLDITKEDVFNIGIEKRIQRNHDGNELKEPALSQAEIKRKKNIERIYGSDIFNRRKIVPIERRRCKQQIKNNTNKSTFFEEIRNNDEYFKDLDYYYKQHRGVKKEYNPDIYLETISPQERYYKHYYENHAEGILPGTYLNSEGNIDDNKLNFIKKKINLHKDERLFNDVGADKKRKEGENPIKEIRYVKKHPITRLESDRRRFVDLDEYLENNCKINKQIQFESYIFTNDTNNYTKTNQEIKEINDRIINEKNKHYHLNVLGQPIIRVNLNKNIEEKGKTIKLRPAKLEWNNPKAEVMFGKEHSKDIYDLYGPKGPNSYQLKLYQFFDSGNVDTLSGVEKNKYRSLERPKKEVKINNESSEKIEEMVSNLPNLNDGQKLTVKMKMSVMDFKNDKELDSKAKTLTDFFQKRKDHNLKVKNKEVTEKVNNIDKKTDENKDYGYHDYVITYSNKGNQFEQFDDNDIKNMFGVKGLNVYDIHKNPFPKGNYNNITLKVMGNDTNNELTQKVKLVEDDLKKKNYKINIQKGDVKNNKKNTKRMTSNPGAKIGIMPDFSDNGGSKFKVMPNEYKKRKGFTKEFVGINYGYKKSMQ